MAEVWCDSAKHWLDVSKGHTCVNKKLLACEDPSKRQIGHVCFCGEAFSIHLEALGSTLHELPEEERELVSELVRTVEGRVRLAAACT